MLLPNEINCIIIEDELPASIVLEMHISKIPFLHLEGKFSSVVKALPVINTEKINLVFLDINLPGISGNHFAKSLNSSIAIIFTTAYTEYAVESFELDVIDYLLKPISFERFTKAINRYLKYHKHSIRQIETADKIVEKPFVFVKRWPVYSAKLNVLFLIECKSRSFSVFVVSLFSIGGSLCISAKIHYIIYATIF